MSIFQGNVIRNEPVLLQSLVQVILGLFLAFGVDLSNEQVGSIMAATAVVLAILVRMVVSPTVTPTPIPPPQQPSSEPPPPAGPTVL